MIANKSFLIFFNIISLLQLSQQINIKSENDDLLKSMTKFELNYYFGESESGTQNDFELISVPVYFWNRIPNSFNASLKVFGNEINFNLVKNVNLILKEHNNSSEYEMFGDYRNDCHYLSSNDDVTVALSNCVDYEIVSYILNENSKINIQYFIERIYLPSKFMVSNISTHKTFAKCYFKKFRIKDKISKFTSPSY